MPISGTRRLMTKGWKLSQIDIKDPSLVLYAPLWQPDMVAHGGSIVNGTGAMDVSPQSPAIGANTITVTAAGTLIVNMPEGGTVASGTMTVTGSPVTISAGIATTITTTGAIGNITVTPSNIIRSKDKNNHAMTVTGATWGSQGRTFDGIDDRIVGNANVTKGLSTVTAMAWVNPTDKSDTQCIIGDYTGANDASLVLEIADSPATSTWKAQSYLDGQGVGAANQTSLITNRAYSQWYHIAVTWKPNTAIIYVNGVLDLTATYTAPNLEPVVTQNTVIGAYKDASGVENLKGLIGEVLVYNRVLTLAEIIHNYQTTKWRYI